MYNEAQKMRFINESGVAKTRIRGYISLFNKAEPFEKKFEADLCMFSRVELQEFCDKATGMRLSSRKTWQTNLSQYLEWAVSNHIIGAVNNLKYISIDGAEKFKLRMVSNPTHLSVLLDKVFRPVSNFSTDTLYRTIYWLAFSGVDIDQIQYLTPENIDLDNMVISSNGKEAPIYAESVLAIKGCINLTQLRAYNPNNPSKYTWKDRADGNILLRGIDGHDGVMYWMQNSSRKVRKANKSGKINCNFTYETIKLSGFFYRLNELEKAGFPPDFLWLTEQMCRDERFKTDANHCRSSKIKLKARSYQEDYMSWKSAFGI